MIRARCSTFSTLVFALVVVAMTGASCADTYPSKPVRLIVAQAAGGGADILARTISHRLAGHWGQQVVVDNRPGGGSIIATELLTKSEPDGYTIMLANISLVINPALHKKLPYDTLRDITPIAFLTLLPTVIAVHPGVAAKSVKDLVDLAKRSDSKLSFGSSGNGSNGHIAGEMLKLVAGINMEHVAYKGGGLVANDLAGGHIQVAFISLATVMPHMIAGRARVLALTDRVRSPTTPNIPIIGETIPGYSVDNWLGIVGRSGTAKALITKLNADIMTETRVPEVKDRLTSMGFNVQDGTPEAFEKIIHSDIEKYGKVVRQARLRVF